jgi:hypothetical protein
MSSLLQPFQALSLTETRDLAAAQKDERDIAAPSTGSNTATIVVAQASKPIKELRPDQRLEKLSTDILCCVTNFLPPSDVKRLLVTAHHFHDRQKEIEIEQVRVDIFLLKAGYAYHLPTQIKRRCVNNIKQDGIVQFIPPGPISQEFLDKATSSYPVHLVENAHGKAIRCIPTAVKERPKSLEIVGNVARIYGEFEQRAIEKELLPKFQQCGANVKEFVLPLKVSKEFFENAISFCPNLQILDFRHYKQIEDTKQIDRPPLKIPPLINLHTLKCELGVRDIDMECFMQCSLLRSLEMSCADITDATFHALVKHNIAQKLELLATSHYGSPKKITDAGLIAVIEANAGCLRQLFVVCDGQITDKFVHALAIKKFPLIFLNLDDSKISMNANNIIRKTYPKVTSRWSRRRLKS